MHGRMQDYMNEQQQAPQPPTPKQEAGKGKAGDYIDFEEVK